MAAPSTPSSSAWDAARRDARRIESELDAELASFSKLVAASGAYDLFSTSSSSEAAARARGGGVSGVGGEAGLAADALAASKAATVERLLQRLTAVNDALAQAAAAAAGPSSSASASGDRASVTSSSGAAAAGSEPSSSSSSSGEARRHTAARHRAVLRDSQAEFRRLSGMLAAARDRADLFAGFGASGGSGNDGAPANATTSLLRERSALSSAHAALDGLLGTASAAGTALFDQRGRLGGAAGRLAAVGDRFPVVGGLLAAIGRRKERDTIIVSAVAGGCAFFTFLYWLRK